MIPELTSRIGCLVYLELDLGLCQFLNGNHCTYSLTRSVFIDVLVYLPILIYLIQICRIGCHYVVVSSVTDCQDIDLIRDQHYTIQFQDQ